MEHKTRNLAITSPTYHLCTKVLNSFELPHAYHVTLQLTLSLFLHL